MKLFLVIALWLVLSGVLFFTVLMWQRNRDWTTPSPLDRPLMRPDLRFGFMCCEHDADCEMRGIPCEAWNGPKVIDAEAVYQRWNHPHGGVSIDPKILPGKYRVGVGKLAVEYTDAPSPPAPTTVQKGGTPHFGRGGGKSGSHTFVIPEGVKTLHIEVGTIPAPRYRCAGYPDCMSFPCPECERIP